MITTARKGATSSEALWESAGHSRSQWEASPQEVEQSADITSFRQEDAIRFGKHVLSWGQPFPPWSRRFLEKISELGDLDEDWDSYGARPIDVRCAMTAAEIVLNLMDSETPAPAIVPTSGGGIQLEWHRAGADLEIEIHSATKLEVFFGDERTGEEREFPLSVNFVPLLPLLHRVTQAD